MGTGVLKLRDGEDFKQEIDAAFDAHEYKKVIRFLKVLLINKPNYPPHYFRMAFCYYLLNDDKNSKKYEEKSLARIGRYSIKYNFHEMLDEFVDLLIAAKASVQPSPYLELLVESNRQFKQYKSNEKELAFEKDLAERVSNLEKAVNESSDTDARRAYLTLVIYQKKLGARLSLHAIDDGDIFIVTKDELARRKAKHPNRQYTLSNVIKNPETGEEKVLTFNVGKHLKVAPPTKSEIKTRLRKQRYYYKHQTEILDSQHKYDHRNKIRKHFRNKLDYMLKQGNAHAYQAEREYENLLK